LSFDLVKIFQEMGLFARCVVGALGVMALAALAVFLERLWVYARSFRASRRFSAEAAELLAADRQQELVLRAQAAKGSHLASLLGGGMQAYLSGPRAGERGLSPVERATRELGRQLDAAAADLRRGMPVLASVGSVAPFVGLLGTVVGIIASFQGIAREGSGGLAAVSAGIAEALIVTALGLVVAIPAVLCFNFLTTRSEALLRALEQARSVFAEYLDSAREEAPEARRARSGAPLRDSGRTEAGAAPSKVADASAAS
jgi:biopolymer transport protein ExbB